MSNFTSSVYLGFRHAWSELRPWRELTPGVPAVLAASSLADGVAARLAGLVGCERAVLAPSTLHLFWDLFGTRAFRGRPVFVDSGTYQIARWGAERALARGTPVTEFAHFDAVSLWRELRDRRVRRPVVVCDGFCPACGRAAPVSEFVSITSGLGGTLLVDDTQSFGILGSRSTPGSFYGTGGGGVLRWSGASGSNVVIAASLAKGFGAPAAVLAGAGEMIMRFENESETRIHCSPVSAAAVHAVEHALDLNDRSGEATRARLFQLVLRFKARLREKGVRTGRTWFPVQTMRSTVPAEAMALHRHLLARGIQTVLHRDRHDATPSVSFLINASHSSGDIDAAADAATEASNRVGIAQGVRHERSVRLGRRAASV